MTLQMSDLFPPQSTPSDPMPVTTRRCHHRPLHLLLLLSPPVLLPPSKIPNGPLPPRGQTVSPPVELLPRGPPEAESAARIWEAHRSESFRQPRPGVNRSIMTTMMVLLLLQRCGSTIEHFSFSQNLPSAQQSSPSRQLSSHTTCDAHLHT